MKIGVLADTHDNLRAITGAVEFFNREGVGHVLHAGDFASPFAINAMGELQCPLTGVFGNNDGDKVQLLDRAAEYRFSLKPAPYSLTTSRPLNPAYSRALRARRLHQKRLLRPDRLWTYPQT